MSTSPCSTPLYLLILLALLASPAQAVQAGSLYVQPSGKSPPLSEEAHEDLYDEWHRPLNLTSRAVLAVPQVDHFGYSLDDTGLLAWVDATLGTEVIYPDKDDGYSQEIPIGFEFDFFEYTYSSLAISTNGFVTFGGGSDSFSNRVLPHDTPPNNLLAPFWDDLHIGSGGIYYLQTTCGGISCFVIEWHQVVRYGTAKKITFETILYKNGDIRYQYLDLGGNLEEATVGIEDADGVDGLLYLYNAPGLSSGKVLHFDRPPAGPRVKMLPLYQSKFAFQRVATFPILVRNTNGRGVDIFDISLTPSAPDWDLDLYAADQQTPLSDSDGDRLPDTGPLAHGNTITIILKVTAPASTVVGDYLNLNISVKSSDDPAKDADGMIQVAVPATFAQAYSDSQSGVLLDMVFHEAQYASQVSSFFTGNTLSVAGGEQGGYFFAWEQNGTSSEDEPAYYSDIYYALLDRFGVASRPLDALTINGPQATPDLVVNARYPAIAIAPDGKVGLLWAHYKLDVSKSRTNSNIYFAILSPSGELLIGPQNVTQNGSWRGQGAEDVPVFSNPRMVVTADNRFFLTWLESYQSGAGEKSSLKFAIFNSSGGVVKPIATFAESTPGVTYFIDPSLAEMEGNRVLLAYSIYSPAQQSYVMAYAMLRSNGTTLQDTKVIPGSNGWRSDAVQLSSGNLLLAWTDPTVDQISYSILDGIDFQVVIGPTPLGMLGGRKPDYVSVTSDKKGRGVLTWMDAEWKDYLYYALVGSSGELLTPAMIFATGEAANPLIQTSFSGQGVAAYKGARRAYFPLIRR